MHLAQGTLTTSVTLLTSVAALTAVGVACYGARREVTQRKMPALFAMSGFVFLAQMVNCSMGFGFSGHLLGGALLAVLFGPWSAMLAMATILTAQVVLLGDGSLTTLGANFLTMGVVLVWVGYAFFHALKPDANIQQDGVDRGQVLALGVAAYLSTVSAAVGLAFILGGQFGSLLYTHSVIGMLESAISGLVFALCAVASKDVRSGLVHELRWKPVAVFCLLALSFVPFSSQLPDGLEYVLDSSLAVAK